MRYLFVLIAAVFCAVVYAQSGRQQTQNVAQNRFAVVTGGSGEIAWRLDTVTGSMSYCLTATGNSIQNSVTRPAGCTGVIP